MFDIMGSPMRGWVIERAESGGGTGPLTLREMSRSAREEMVRKEQLEFNERSGGIADVSDF